MKKYRPLLYVAIMASLMLSANHFLHEDRPAVIEKPPARDTTYDWWVRARNSERHKRAIKEFIIPETK